MKRKVTTWELRLTNQEKNNLVKVQKARKAVRNFLAKEGFLEVDLPVILSSKLLLYGGVPISGQKINGYLCPAMAHLIRRWFVIGREFNFSKVYFIGKCFRDEKVDDIHYPVYENLIIGVLGKDYQFMMKLIPKMISSILRTMGQGNIGEWQRIPYFQLNPKTNFSTAKINDEEALEEYNELTSVLVEPTFVTELPLPLLGPARRINQYTKERAELFINGIEIANIETVLTNSEELLQWYREQNTDFNQYTIEKEQLESITTLEGEVITTGAIGLSRLYMILFGLNTIKETVAFPYFGGD